VIGVPVAAPGGRAPAAGGEPFGQDSGQGFLVDAAVRLAQMHHRGAADAEPAQRLGGLLAAQGRKLGPGVHRGAGMGGLAVRHRDHLGVAQQRQQATDPSTSSSGCGATTSGGPGGSTVSARPTRSMTSDAADRHRVPARDGREPLEAFQGSAGPGQREVSDFEHDRFPTRAGPAQSTQETTQSAWRPHGATMALHGATTMP
jgi:hypothetical protein